MRNRAKCKLCTEVIESKTINDYVSCSCGEISIDGGLEKYSASARNFDNFFRIDDEDNEISVIVKDKENDIVPIKLTKRDLLETLDEMIKRIEDLPPIAMSTYINHYDYCSLLILMQSLFLLEDKHQS